MQAAARARDLRLRIDGRLPAQRRRHGLGLGIDAPHRRLAGRLRHAAQGRRLRQHRDRAAGQVQRQLGPDGIADARGHLGFHASGAQRRGNRFRPRRHRPVRLAQHQPVAAIAHLNKAGFENHAGRMHHTANHPPHAHRLAQHIAGIELRQCLAVQCAAMGVEIPPGYAVQHEHHRRVGPQQRPDTGGDGSQRRRLGGDHHRILRAQRARIVRGGHLGGVCLVRRLDCQATRPNPRQVRPSHHHRDIRAAFGEARRQMAANGPGAINTDPHGSGQLIEGGAGPGARLGGVGKAGRGGWHGWLALEKDAPMMGAPQQSRKPRSAPPCAIAWP